MICTKVKDILKEMECLINNVPSIWMSYFFISVVGMNLLANKSIDMKLDWLALDSAFLFSWLSFLTMDVITKRFGPRASSMVSVLALMGNLVFALVLFIASVIPGTWSGTDGNESINKIFDDQYGGTWFIIVPFYHLLLLIMFLIGLLDNVLKEILIAFVHSL